MSMNPERVQRKLEQHDNEFLAVWDELVAIRAIVDGHTETLESHTQILESHTQTLAAHSTFLREHSQTLAVHTTILNEHTGLLHEILRRLPDAS